MAQNEVVNVHIGRAGCAIGEKTWELYCLDHGIGLDGKMTGKGTGTESIFFSGKPSGRLNPRAVFVDLEPTVIDGIRSGKSRGLFQPQFFVQGREDTSSNYASGYYGLGTKLMDNTLDRLRKQVDACDNFQGFLLHHSSGGGTGSGFSSLLYKHLQTYFGPKKVHMAFIVDPDPEFCVSSVEPYNQLMNINALTSAPSKILALPFGNHAIREMCKRNLSVEYPTYRNMNNLIAQIVAATTTSLRFADGGLNHDISQIHESLMPFPGLPFALASYAPLQSARSPPKKTSLVDCAFACLEPGMQSVTCDPRLGKYLTCNYLYRGTDINPKAINEIVATLKVKRAIQFIEMLPSVFKNGINLKPPPVFADGDLAKLPHDCLMLSSTTAIAEHYNRASARFALLFAKRAFVHHYLENGMEESEFAEARERVNQISRDYEEVSVSVMDDEAGDEDDGF